MISDAVKFILAAMLAAPAAMPCHAQEASGPIPQACGPPGASLAVDLDNSQHKLEPPEPGTARIYFIQDAGTPVTFAYPTTKIGIDGKWVGANKKNSYFSATENPGEHHICAEVQSSFARHDIEFAHLRVEAGKTYYYRTRLLVTRDGLEYLGLNLADTDEANYLIDSYPLATAHLRK